MEIEEVDIMTLSSSIPSPIYSNFEVSPTIVFDITGPANCTVPFQKIGIPSFAPEIPSRTIPSSNAPDSNETTLELKKHFLNIASELFDKTILCKESKIFVDKYSKNCTNNDVTNPVCRLICNKSSSQFCFLSRKTNCKCRTSWICDNKCKNIIVPQYSHPKTEMKKFCFNSKNNCFLEYHSKINPNGCYPDIIQMKNTKRPVQKKCVICKNLTTVFCSKCLKYFCLFRKRSCFYDDAHISKH